MVEGLNTSEPYVSAGHGDAWAAEVAGLRALIVDGDVAPGERLPSSTELTRRYGGNTVSIGRAIAILEYDVPEPS